MPRDGSNIYHRPPGTDGVPNYTVESARYNAFTADIEQDLNLPRPVIAGGTGANNAADAMKNLGGELSAQLISNYNSDPFQAGSFYSAAGATGAPTVNAFTGICYSAVITGSVTTDLFIEARDQTTTNMWVRQKKANVWQPWAQAAGVTTGPSVPTSVSPNTLWWDPTRGKLFIYYQDVDSSQWVEAVAVPDVDVNTFVEIAGDNMTGPLILSADPTLPLGAATKQYTDAGDAATAAVVTAALTLPGYLFGLTMSTAGSSATMTVAPGVACDSTGTRLMKLTATMAKTTAAWAAGNGTGGLDTGAITASTWYHWFLIGNATTGAVDVVFSKTATPASGPTTMPPGYTLFRRIGGMWLNASSQWYFFHQLGDEFLMDVAFTSAVSLAVPDTLAHLLTLFTPPGIQVWALVTGQLTGGAAVDTRIYFSSPDKSDEVATGGNITSGVGAITANTGIGPFSLSIRTDTNKQIRYRAVAASTSLFLNTAGWIDRRGRDA